MLNELCNCSADLHYPTAPIPFLSVLVFHHPCLWSIRPPDHHKEINTPSHACMLSQEAVCKTRNDNEKSKRAYCTVLNNVGWYKTRTCCTPTPLAPCLLCSLATINPQPLSRKQRNQTNDSLLLCCALLSVFSNAPSQAN